MTDQDKQQNDDKNHTPQSLVTKEHVKKCLAADKGVDAILESWVLEDFTKKGDNYCCIVSSVKVKYAIKDESFDDTYIVKLNPCRKMKSFEEFWRMNFVKEQKFYTTLAPELNSMLENNGLEPLKVPQYFHGSLEPEKELIFLEDLRKKNFKMVDRQKGMDVAHLQLVVKELGRLHAASVLLQDQYKESGTSFTIVHDYLKQDWVSINDNSDGNVVFSLFENYLTNTITILEKATGYEKAIAWVRSLRPQLRDIAGDTMLNSRCQVFCHGDCWNNNILFRYDELGNPIDLMFLDLQLCRYASPATDLNYLMYSSVDGHVRKKNLLALLSFYYESFKDTMGNREVPFREEEIVCEYKEKHKYGALFAMMLVPISLIESTEVPDMAEMTDDGLEDYADQFKVSVLKMMDNDGDRLKSRFLSLFDEYLEDGYFDLE